jgi:hypothetical protein
VGSLLDLRTPAEADADYLFHVSNSHAKVGSKFVTENIEHVLTAHFSTDVGDGNGRLVAREELSAMCDVFRKMNFDSIIRLTGV